MSQLVSASASTHHSIPADFFFLQVHLYLPDDLAEFFDFLLQKLDVEVLTVPCDGLGALGQLGQRLLQLGYFAVVL